MKGRLVFFSSATGDGAPRIYTLARHLGWDLVKALAATKPMRVQSPQVITQVLERGERGVGFLQNDNIAWRSKLQGKPTDYVFPAEGVPTELGACGLLANSSRPHAAALFFEWWMSPEGQAILVKGGKYSSRTDVAPPTGSTAALQAEAADARSRRIQERSDEDSRPDDRDLRRRVGQLRIAWRQREMDMQGAAGRRAARRGRSAGHAEADASACRVWCSAWPWPCCCSSSAIRCCG